MEGGGAQRSWKRQGNRASRRYQPFQHLDVSLVKLFSTSGLHNFERVNLWYFVTAESYETDTSTQWQFLQTEERKTYTTRLTYTLKRLKNYPFRSPPLRQKIVFRIDGGCFSIAFLMISRNNNYILFFLFFSRLEEDKILFAFYACEAYITYYLVFTQKRKKVSCVADRQATSPAIFLI